MTTSVPDCQPVGASWGPILESCQPWHVLHVRSRTEKKVSDRLASLHQPQLTSILPLWTRKQRYQRRLVTTRLPLFPGYLFVRSDLDAVREFATRTREVVSCLSVVNQDKFAESMLGIAKMTSEGEDLRPESRVHRGMNVEIKSGVLQGMRGTVIAELKSLRFILALDAMDMGASVEVQDWMIEPLS